MAGWVYTMFFVMVGWVFFRSESLTKGLHYLGVMFGHDAEHGIDSKTLLLLSENLAFFVFAILFSMPLHRWFGKLVSKIRYPQPLKTLGDILYAVWLVCIMVVSVSYLAKGAHDPFIYFNF